MRRCCRPRKSSASSHDGCTQWEKTRARALARERAERRARTGREIASPPARYPSRRRSPPPSGASSNSPRCGMPASARRAARRARPTAQRPTDRRALRGAWRYCGASRARSPRASRGTHASARAAAARATARAARRRRRAPAAQRRVDVKGRDEPPLVASERGGGGRHGAKQIARRDDREPRQVEVGGRPLAALEQPVVGGEQQQRRPRQRREGLNEPLDLAVDVRRAARAERRAVVEGDVRGRRHPRTYAGARRKASA